MRKIFSLDRVEDDIAVCISDDDIQIDIPLKDLGGLEVHDVFSAEYEGGEISDVTPRPDERDRRLTDHRERLIKLIKRSNK